MTVVNNETDQSATDDIDQAIVRAVGEELRRARASAGWSRPDLVKRMRTQVPVNTYACYEQGIRQCSIPRLYEICQALEVSVPDLLGLAFQRLQLDLDRSGIFIDLNKILSDRRKEIKPLRQWAHNRIQADALTAGPDEPAVVRLQWAVVSEMAIFCGVPRARLLSYISEFTPEAAQRP
jgi:transcriptional regulator with XRE-family HTH domain